MFYQTRPVARGGNFSLSRMKPWNYPLHMHRSFELVCATSGELCVTVEHRDYMAAAGEAVLIFPHQLHGFQEIGAGHGFLSIFAPELCASFYNRFKNSLPVENLMPFTYDFEKISACSDIFSIKAFLYSVCAAAFKTLKFVPRPARQERTLLDKILAFVEDNYKEPCTLYDAARELKYDYGYLSKYFLKNIGTSFNDYVNRRRISDATYLLRSGENTDIGEIAMECGYDSIRSFNRNFKKICAKTPKEYRAGID